jgi:flavin-dependent dehydrogenase
VCAVAWLLAEAEAAGVRVVRAALVGAQTDTDGGAAASSPTHHLRVRMPDTGAEQVLRTRAVVLAVGPHLRAVAKLFGLDVPVVNEIHARVRPTHP